MEIKKRRRGHVVVFDIIGDFQRPEAKINPLPQRVKHELDKGCRKIIFNIEQMGNVDDFGAGEFMASLIHIRKEGGILIYIPLKTFVERGWSANVLNAQAHVYDDEEDAINWLSK
jgi:hypothetical protein